MASRMYKKNLEQFNSLTDLKDKEEFVKKLQKKRANPKIGRKQKTRLTQLIHRMQRNIASQKQGRKDPGTKRGSSNHWRYGGFRSMQELIWATTFEMAGLDYEYEADSFWLADGTQYLPDFHIAWGWVEVKYMRATDREKEKARLLSLAAREPVAIVAKPWNGNTVYSVWIDGEESEGRFNGKGFQEATFTVSEEQQRIIHYIHRVFLKPKPHYSLKYAFKDQKRLKRYYPFVWRAYNHNHEQGWVDYRGEVDALGNPLKKK